LGAPDSENLRKSGEASRLEIERCNQLEITYLNFHPGAAIDKDPQFCLDLIAESLLMFEPVLSLGSTRLLLENTAGQGSAVGWRFEDRRADARHVRRGRQLAGLVGQFPTTQQLLKLMRIKAEGDYDAIKKLVDTYGVHFDPKLRDEVVARVDRLRLPSYTGFVMPKLEAVTSPSGDVTDVTLSYPRDLTTQMIEYSAATRPMRQ
jgi:hypothetical protein